MSTFPLSSENLLGSREVRFINRQESNYPTLMRLCMDFDFCVLQLQRKVESGDQESQSFVLASSDYRDQEHVITPTCESLRALDAYVTQHQVDILHDYLFGGSEDSFSEQVS